MSTFIQGLFEYPPRQKKRNNVNENFRFAEIEERTHFPTDLLSILLGTVWRKAVWYEKRNCYSSYPMAKTNENDEVDGAY